MTVTGKSAVNPSSVASAEAQLTPLIRQRNALKTEIYDAQLGYDNPTHHLRSKYAAELKKFNSALKIVNNKINAIQNGPALQGQAGFESPHDMKYNLPPHKWSLPLNNSEFDGNVGGSPDHSLRRAIIWFYGGADILSNNDVFPNYGTQDNTYQGNGSTNPPQAYSSTPLDNYWGFQFLWNPTSLTSSISRNSNVVPSVTDVHGPLSGIFTAMEAVQFTIVLDRVNDFACARGLKNKSYTDLYKYYSSNVFPTLASEKTKSDLTIEQKLDELYRKGTGADLEYLFRTINGSGQNGQVWTNALNRVTADIGFLTPNAVGFQLSPGNPDSLSYVGWIESLSINHTIFTQDMIPLHTEVNVTLNAFSRSAFTNAGVTQ